MDRWRRTWWLDTECQSCQCNIYTYRCKWFLYSYFNCDRKRIVPGNKPYKYPCYILVTDSCTNSRSRYKPLQRNGNHRYCNYSGYCYRNIYGSDMEWWWRSRKLDSEC